MLWQSTKRPFIIQRTIDESQRNIELQNMMSFCRSETGQVTITGVRYSWAVNLTLGWFGLSVTKSRRSTFKYP